MFRGPSGSPFYSCLDKNLKPSLAFRTLFLQEMTKNGVFMPWVAICKRHSKKELAKTLEALQKTLYVYKKSLYPQNKAECSIFSETDGTQTQQECWH